MRVTFINPQGRINNAFLSKEGFFKLMTMTGYTITDFDFSLPKVPAFNNVKPRVHVSDDICVSCSG